MLPGNILDDVLELHDVVSCAGQGVEAPVDLGLASGADLVVGPLDLHVEALHDGDDLVTQITEVVGGGHREVTALVLHLVTAVAAVLSASGVPGTSLGVDGVVRGVLASVEANVVEDVELGLGGEKGSVSDTGGGEVGLGLACDVARVAAVGLLGDRVVDVEVHDERPGWRIRRRPDRSRTGPCRTLGRGR